ncbi:UNVERIFIED_CONTAM: hypothetical protein Sindi_0210400 [Sesamum indicum]
MQDRNQHISTDESSAHGKQQREKGPKRRNVLAKKIGAIISSTCGSRSKAQEMCVDEAKVCSMGNKKRHHQVALNKSLSFHAKGKRKGNSRNQSHEANKRCLTMSCIFRKRYGFGFRKRRAIKIGNANANSNEDSGLKRSSHERITRARLMLKRGVKRGQKARVAEDDDRELELCKKRILMGEKCRPLNISGTLHYDKYGVLLPEDVLPSEEP